jgi:hypothetical protein
MIRSALGRAVLALTAGLGVWSGAAWAQQCQLEPAAPESAYQMLNQQWKDHKSGWSFPLCSAVVNNPPLCHWSTHNEMLSTNLRSELVFVFGSSRHFYGEPYVKGPPVFPFPVYMSYATCPGWPGHCGYEGRPEYPLRPYPPGYEGRPYTPCYQPPRPPPGVEGGGPGCAHP